MPKSSKKKKEIIPEPTTEQEYERFKENLIKAKLNALDELEELMNHTQNESLKVKIAEDILKTEVKEAKDSGESGPVFNFNFDKINERIERIRKVTGSTREIKGKKT